MQCTSQNLPSSICSDAPEKVPWSGESGRDSGERILEGIRILSICDDESLGLSRQLILENAGYLTATMESAVPLSVLYVRRFDAAIICQSVNSEHAVQLAEKLHRDHPGIRVLRASLFGAEAGICYDGVCDSLAGPARLFQAIEALMREARNHSSISPTATMK